MIRHLISKPCPRCGGPVRLGAVLSLSGLAGIPCPHCAAELQVAPLVRIGVVLLSLAAAEAVDLLPPEMDYLCIAARPVLLAVSYAAFTCLLARLRCVGNAVPAPPA